LRLTKIQKQTDDDEADEVERKEKEPGRKKRRQYKALAAVLLVQALFPVLLRTDAVQVMF
jgi:hypothetical protein